MAWDPTQSNSFSTVNQTGVFFHELKYVSHLERTSWNLLVAEVDVGVVDARLCRLKPDLKRVVLHGVSRDWNVSSLWVSHRQADITYKTTRVKRGVYARVLHNSSRDTRRIL